MTQLAMWQVSGCCCTCSSGNGIQNTEYAAQGGSLVHLLVYVILKRPPRWPILGLPHLQAAYQIYMNTTTHILISAANVPVTTAVHTAYILQDGALRVASWANLGPISPGVQWIASILDRFRFRIRLLSRQPKLLPNQPDQGLFDLRLWQLPHCRSVTPQLDNRSVSYRLGNNKCT